MVTTSRVSGTPRKFGYGMPRYFCEISSMLSAPPSVVRGDDATAHRVVPRRVVGIHDVDRDAWITGDVAGLLHAVDDVDHDVLAVGGDPGLRQLRRAIRHDRRDEARAGTAQQVRAVRRAGVLARGSFGRSCVATRQTCRGSGYIRNTCSKMFCRSIRMPMRRRWSSEIAALERLKSAAAAGQARATAALARNAAPRRPPRGVPRAKRGRGLASEMALARRDSPARGGRHLGFARPWCTRCRTPWPPWNPGCSRNGGPP